MHVEVPVGGGEARTEIQYHLNITKEVGVHAWRGSSSRLALKFQFASRLPPLRPGQG